MRLIRTLQISRPGCHMKFMARLGLFLLAIFLSATYMTATDLAILHNGFSIRHERREVNGAVTRLYLVPSGSGYVDVPTDQIERFDTDASRPILASAPQPAALDLGQVIDSASGRYHLDPDLINSVIHAESGFNQHAVSAKGAQGLMQLMPGTSTRMGVANPFDASANVEGGAHYLRELLERYHFDLVKALAAYNAGPQRVEQYHGVPPYHETQAYVARIVRDFNRRKEAEKRAAKPAAPRPTKTSSSSRRVLPTDQRASVIPQNPPGSR